MYFRVLDDNKHPPDDRLQILEGGPMLDFFRRTQMVLVQTMHVPPKFNIHFGG